MSYGASPAGERYYVENNWGTWRLPTDIPLKDNWESMGSGSGTLSTTYKRTSRWPSQAGIPITRVTMTKSYAQTILQTVGASRPVRDSLDTTYVNDFDTNKYWVGFSEATYPTLSGGSPPTDSDNDGMSDAWEVSTFGDLSKTASGYDVGNGYTNIENYLHYLGGYVASEVPTPPKGFAITPQ
jgi:hypothetical protein